jgi:ATP adenylyltransferase
MLTMTSVSQLWAPWRLQYVTAAPPVEGSCVLCDKPREDDDRGSLVVARGEHVYALLNLYPYNNGHVMVVPYRHVAALEELTDAEAWEAQLMLRSGITACRAALSPGGFNVGLNLGEAAGAGIAQHLHWHLVPRWDGDTNFMPVLAEVRVMPQHLDTTWQLLRDAWPASYGAPSTPPMTNTATPHEEHTSDGM